jgi:hypothetical protein
MRHQEGAQDADHEAAKEQYKNGDRHATLKWGLAVERRQSKQGKGTDCTHKCTIKR